MEYFLKALLSGLDKQSPQPTAIHVSNQAVCGFPAAGYFQSS
jgi:hypothetical protein